MTCGKVRDALALAAVGDDEPVAPEIVNHLALCEECVAAHRRYLTTSGRLLDAVAPVAPPAALRVSILERAVHERPELHDSIVERESADPASSTQEANQSERKRPRSEHPPARRAWGWAVATFLLAAVNVALLWDGRAEKEKLNRLDEGVAALRAELNETWNAFSGAPAVYAGSLDFEIGALVDSVQASARGYLYARANGWAVLFHMDGLSNVGDETFDVWLETDAGWERQGALHVDVDGTATWIYYAREPEVTLRRLHVAGVGATPGSPGWVSQAIASARVVAVANPVVHNDAVW